MQDIKDAFFRSQGTLAQDAAGALALVVILLGCLYLPGFH
jgi:hypothetical protein